MSPLKKLLGIAPQPTGDGAFSPSPLALKLATVSKTNFDGGEYANPHTGGLKVLMICTEDGRMVMKNGKTFSTGNHPVEMALPMLHLIRAGFAIDIATPTGAPVQIEHWAMPEDDEAIMALFRDHDEAFANPLRLGDALANAKSGQSPYVAIFLPGGHGAMLGLPDSADVGAALHWAHENDLYTLAICHGPAALLAATGEGPFLYHGYDIAAFPDAVDRQTPMIGYMPGHVPWKFGERLEAQGVTIVNTKADDTCHTDRKLITGASPKAANAFGRLAAETLLDAVKGRSG